MPYDWKDDGTKACVFKKGQEDNPLHCYDDKNVKTRERKAKKYLRALYSNEQEKEQDMKASEQLDDTITFEQVNGPIKLEIVASEDGGRLLMFKNAVLARVETNKNNDDIDSDGLNELASTIAGMPIDYEHRMGEIRGVYTDGKAVDGKLVVDGFIWASRFPQEAEDVKSGILKQSVEASAKSAVCSMCGGMYASASEYCEHLSRRKTTGAKRQLKGLLAQGGALTKNPAATNPTFDPSQIYMVASHEENVSQDLDSENKLQSDECNSSVECEKCGSDKDNLVKENEKEMDCEELKKKNDELEATVSDLTSKLQDKTKESDELAKNKENAVKECSEMKASSDNAIAEKDKAIQEMTASLNEIRSKYHKAVLLASYTEDEINEMSPKLSGMNDDQIVLLASVKRGNPAPSGVGFTEPEKPKSKEPITWK